MNRFERLFGLKGEAKLRYMRTLRPGEVER